MPTRKHSRRDPDPAATTRRRVIWFGLLIVGASFAFYAVTYLLTGTGQTSSIFVGAGISLVGIGLSPQLAQLISPGREYEPPPRELPEPDWNNERPDQRGSRGRRRD